VNPGDKVVSEQPGTHIPDVKSLVIIGQTIGMAYNMSADPHALAGPTRGKATLEQATQIAAVTHVQHLLLRRADPVGDHKAQAVGLVGGYRQDRQGNLAIGRVAQRIGQQVVEHPVQG